MKASQEVHWVALVHSRHPDEQGRQLVKDGVRKVLSGQTHTLFTD